MDVSGIEVFGEADPEKYPLQKKGHTLEFLREIAHLRPRTNTFGAIFGIRNALAVAVHEFFQARGFVWAHTPLITASDCEGAGALFQVTTLDLGNPHLEGMAGRLITRRTSSAGAYLTVSGQLEGELLACRWVMSIRSARPSARRIPIRRAISRSSG